MISKTVETYWAEIHIAGPKDVAEQVCRKFCLNVGLCVTVTPTKYIYTGGEETGVVVGLINYPRFPSAKTDIEAKADELGRILLREMHQHSYLIITPDETRWRTIRPQ